MRADGGSILRARAGVDSEGARSTARIYLRSERRATAAATYSPGRDRPTWVLPLTEHRLLMQRQDRGALRAPRLGRVPTVSAGPEHACICMESNSHAPWTKQRGIGSARVLAGARVSSSACAGALLRAFAFARGHTTCRVVRHNMGGNAGVGRVCRAIALSVGSRVCTDTDVYRTLQRTAPRAQRQPWRAAGRHEGIARARPTCRVRETMRAICARSTARTVRQKWNAKGARTQTRAKPRTQTQANASAFGHAADGLSGDATPRHAVRTPLLGEVGLVRRRRILLAAMRRRCIGYRC